MGALHSGVKSSAKKAILADREGVCMRTFKDDPVYFVSVVVVLAIAVAALVYAFVHSDREIIVAVVTSFGVAIFQVVAQQRQGTRGADVPSQLLAAAPVMREGERKALRNNKQKQRASPARPNHRSAILNVVGAVLVLGSIVYSMHEMRMLQMEKAGLTTAVEQQRADHQTLRSVVEMLNQEHETARLRGSARQRFEPAHKVIPVPSGGALIVASVVGPDTKNLTREQTREISCYPGYSVVPVHNKDEEWPGRDTNGGPPLCNTSPPTKCMDKGVRCWNRYLMNGCLVSTEWLVWYKAQIKKNGSPFDPGTVCDADVTL